MENGCPSLYDSENNEMYNQTANQYSQKYQILLIRYYYVSLRDKGKVIYRSFTSIFPGLF